MNIKRGGSREPKKPPLDPPLSRGASCRFPHACQICFQRNHPATHCPRAYAGNFAGTSPAYVGPPPTYTGPLASAPPPNPAGAR